MGSFNELYSNFGFFSALPLGDYNAAVTGDTIDLINYGTIAFAVQINSLASGGGDLGAGLAWKFVLQHGLASALGVSAWSLVPGSQLIHSVYGGYDSTASTGVFQIVGSVSDAIFANASGQSGFFFCGYKKDVLHRYIRLYVSVSDAPSACTLGAMAIAGNPGVWPVNEPV